MIFSKCCHILTTNVNVFYWDVIDQHKVVHNCEVEGKWYMVLFLIFYK